MPGTRAASGPELWSLWNTRLNPGEGMRVFPLSNWTEFDVWDYIAAEAIPVVPLYFAAPRAVVRRSGMLNMRDIAHYQLAVERRNHRGGGGEGEGD
jgi:sulfate adenylyltransferase subunit 2